MELQRSVYLSVRLLEGVAYAEDAWIDILLGYDRFNIQFITVISNRLLLFHGVKGCGAAALERYGRRRKRVRKALARNSKAVVLRNTRSSQSHTLASHTPNRVGVLNVEHVPL